MVPCDAGCPRSMSTSWGTSRRQSATAFKVVGHEKLYPSPRHPTSHRVDLPSTQMEAVLDFDSRTDSGTPLSVTIDAGTIEGTHNAGVAHFLGIPYAAAPVGPHRFRPPAPVEPWSGTRSAHDFGPTAPKGAYPPYARDLLPEVTIDGDEWLNLNVWTPAEAFNLGAGLLPVMVWIHGGSFTNGSGSVAGYDGTSFARDGVVTVTINYRLGAEGSLVAPGISPNLGLQDQVAALTWVRENIHVFGGDPARVTIAGESAGAMSVGALLIMPSARGLFSAAILQSGAVANFHPIADARRTAERLSSHLGVTATRETLASVTPADVVIAAGKVSGEVFSKPDPAIWGHIAALGLPFAPVLDGEILPLDALEALRTGPTVPVLLGTTRDEERLFLVPTGAAASVTEEALPQVAARYGLSPAGVTVYRNSHPDLSPGEVLAAIGTDYRFRLRALAAVSAMTDTTQRASGSAAPVWVYRFDGLSGKANNGLGSCHATEIPFVFDTVSDLQAPLIGRNPSPEITAVMHGSWVQFIANHTLDWTPWTAESKSVALLSDHIEVVQNPGGAELLAWEG